MNRLCCSLLLLASLPGVVFGLEIGTHAAVTKVAVDASVLSPTHPFSIGPVLGFNRLDTNTPFAATFGLGDPEASYFDNEPHPTIPLNSEDADEAYLREPQNLEGDIFDALALKGVIPGAPTRADFEQRVDAWVMRGAVREDDIDIGPIRLGDRDDDPWGIKFRVSRHFYDPRNDSALTDPRTCTVVTCLKTTEWALGRINVLTGPGTLDTMRENHFSWQDARDNYWWALTYNLTDELGFAHGYAQNVESGYRKFRFATMLKSVGQVVHLLQDMAQPQHTRNDGHGPPATVAFTGDHPADAAFEAYTEARLFHRLPAKAFFTNPLTHFDGAPLTDDDLPKLNLSGNVAYPVPSFSTPVEFFTTQNTPTSIASRRGLADLSNRGFFTASTLPINVVVGSPGPLVASYLDPPLPVRGSTFFQVTTLQTNLYYLNTYLRRVALLGEVPDILAPNWNAQSGLFTKYGSDGRMPLLAASQWGVASGLVPPTPTTENSKFAISTEVLTAQADALLPRAVSYSTGLINYFFRGRLEITPNAQNVFAVMNQGEPHTVDAEGYPRRADNRIFGFEKLRLKIRNVTEAIVESGPVTTPIPQTSGMGTLVAVARYHRNACYKRDMSGERTIGYAPAPGLGAITEPSCAGLTTRTDYPEISVSAPITIASAADLPGGQGTGGPAAVDKVFDFTDDPVPVNATDLFVQVVYRGQLGDEPDGIAVGSYDVREPTFVGIFNNTDYYWHTSQARWIIHNATALYPWQNADYVRVCSGASADSRWMYYAEPVAGFPALGIPSPEPGVIRLAMVFARPNPATQQFVVRVTPVMSGASAAQRSFTTRGQQHQANKERIATSVLNAPLICTETAPTASSYWCNTPIKQRRGIKLGEVLAPVHYDNGFGNPGGDVDAQPLPIFPGLRLKEDGLVKFNDMTLSNCPAAPTRSVAAAELIEWIEMAADAGVDVGG
jgi:hypothetical protein